MGNTIQADRWLHSALHDINQLKAELHKKGSTLTRNEYEKLLQRILASLHEKLNHAAQNGDTPSEQKRDPATQVPPAPSTPGKRSKSLISNAVRSGSVAIFGRYYG